MSRKTNLLAQADLLLLLADILALPTEEFVESLDSTLGSLDSLLRNAGLYGPLDCQTSLHLLRSAQETGTPTLQEEYNRLFEAGVVVPINEAGFVRRDKGHILGDISGFYRAFGMDITEEHKERVDHIGCQLEYMAMLLVMLVRAEEEGLTEQADITAGGLSTFLAEHPGEWFPLFWDRLASHTRLDYYRGAAGLLEQVFIGMLMGHGVSVTPAESSGALEDDGSPYECGKADRGEA